MLLKFLPPAVVCSGTSIIMSAKALLASLYLVWRSGLLTFGIAIFANRLGILRTLHPSPIRRPGKG